MVTMKEVGTEEATIQVVSTDGDAGKLLEHDSNMEVEMMELFKDLSLEDIVSNKACVGKVVGCKNMAASIVKKILQGIWDLEKGWKMKKFEEGVLGFFFDSKDDCTMVMNRRPWLVNGVLLNLKPWPIEVEVSMAEFEVARFWVEFHGLPTRCLSEVNAPILAKKVGTFIKIDGRKKGDVSLPSSSTTANGGLKEKEGPASTLHGTVPMLRSGIVGSTKFTTDARKDKEFPSLDFADEIGPIANVDVIPDIGPTLIQGLDIPHIWSCKAKPSLISNPPNVSELITHLLGMKKRKAHTWYSPTPDIYQDSLFKNSNAQLVTITDSLGEPSTGERDSVDTPVAIAFNTGTFEPGESSKAKSRRKKSRGIVSTTRRTGLGSRISKLGEAEEIDIDPGLAPWHLYCIYGTPYGGQKGGRSFGRMEGELLQNFLMDCDGINLGFIGAVAGPEWCTRFPHAGVKHFPIVNSDHAPLILDSHLNSRKLKYPFRFLEVWTFDSTCGKTIEQAWKLRELYSRLALIQNAPISPGAISKEDQIQMAILNLEHKMERIWK
ncbi:hypothetical protein G4B88_003395 [Cannabis sativa]|uniref:DUF4283 domain-containing protein n=1 Tax=Cannabis sativa TaxID=3483 RepID=A0A7J6DJS5_CANSA|nr:hypothetical protein G4B88_003395 [Cannabis sativa]